MKLLFFKKGMIVLLLVLFFAVVGGCKPTEEPFVEEPEDIEEPIDEEELTKHLILDRYGNYGGTTNSSKYGFGAPLNGAYDHPDSEYYITNDYYNMESTADRTIFTNFAPYQQTMAKSDGIASALMILNYFGEDVINSLTEVELVERYEELTSRSVYEEGANASGLKSLFIDLGYTADAGVFSESGSTTNDKIANFVLWVRYHLDRGRFIMVRYQDGIHFGWHVIIGHESMGTDYPRDDIIILADPKDDMDHFQDGYFTSAAGRLYRWWLQAEKSGQTNNLFDCVVVYPKTPRIINRITEERVITQVIPERHLILNADGSFGGSTNEELYGSSPFINGEADQLTSYYHRFVDYYNMESTNTRLILTGYQPFQQTMASSCGISSVLTVLNYYGLDVSIYNEVYLTEKYCEVNDVATIKNVGVGSSGLKKLVATLGFVAVADSYSRANYVDEDSMNFSNYEGFLEWVQTNLEKGTPLPISWRPHVGHWETIIGIDTMGTDYIYDDVIILADSGDTWDHYQDGFNTIPATLFFGQWYNGSFTYNQQYCVFDNIDS